MPEPSALVSPGAPVPHPRGARAYAALAAVCFFWGTTYLGIRMALESFPPITLVAIRFTVSGSVLLLAAVLAGARMPRGRELWTTAVTGILLLGGGNACLVFAELWIPSGLAALIITISPFWMVGIEALMPGGERLRRATVLGMLVGCAGAGLLVSADLGSQSLGPGLLHGFLLLQLGNLCWGFGSVYYRRQETRAHPIVTGAVQQLAAGLVFIPIALLIPEQPMHPTFRGVAAICYLVVFGSIVGYSAYIYALSHLPVAVVSIYSYVNPVVAVFLGWLFYREPFGLREATAMVIILVGVAIVKRYSPEGAH
ncbi:MAG: EamA family transporter [Bryobacteraceae bacterium]